MSDSGKAVFLSYASQDAEAAKRICEALRQAGVEVWFDQSELRGGDAWDANIRKQIKECALFVPVISANTQARAEGYFRREWRLAVDRMHDLADDHPFLLPVVIDDTPDAAARVPERFRERQWTRLPLRQAQGLQPGGETSAAFSVQVKKLLAGGPAAIAVRPAAPQRAGRAPAWQGIKWWWVLPIFGMSMALFLVLKESHDEPAPAASTTASVAPPAAAPVSEARALSLRASALLADPMLVKESVIAAEELCARAVAIDPQDGEAWAVYALVATELVGNFGDDSSVQKENARSRAERAIRLAPDSVNATLAMAEFEFFADNNPKAAEVQLRALLARAPDDKRIAHILARAVAVQGRSDESFALLDAAARRPGGNYLALARKGWSLLHTDRWGEVEAAFDASLALQPNREALHGKLLYLVTCLGDLARARALLESLPPGQLREDRVAYLAYQMWMRLRQPDQAAEALRRISHDFIQEGRISMPTRFGLAEAQQLAGRPQAARVEWESALATVEQRLKAEPADPTLVRWRALLLARLGRKADAERAFGLGLELSGIKVDEVRKMDADLLLDLGREDDALTVIKQRMGPGENFSPTFFLILREDPRYDPLRARPEFAAALKEGEIHQREFFARVGLPPSPAAEGAAGRPATDDSSSAKATEDWSGKALAPDQKSVAVLAFTNLSDDKNNEYFSDGISEELLNVLAKIPGLKVTARTSSFFFKGKEVPVPEIAQKLGVAYVVEGSVRKSGDKVRITAQLIKAADGFHVWSDTFTRDLKDIFAVQDEIAGVIAKNLQLKMGITAARPTIDLEAYQAYLTGRALFAKAGNGDLQEAVGHFERAVAIEPRFTAAWVQLASAHTQLGRWGGAPTLQAWSAARAAIDHARALEPDSPDVLLALGWILRTADWDWRGAEQAFRRSLQLRPNHPDTLAGLAVLLFNLGQKEEAFRLGQQAAVLDPLNPATQIDLSLMFYLNNNLAEAERSARRALQLAPGGAGYHCILAWSLIKQGRLGEAETAAALDSDAIEKPLTYGLLALARGQETVAREKLAELEAISRTNGNLADLQNSIAWIAVGLGEKERPFAALEKARDSRDPSNSWLRSSPYLDPLHSDPRWNALLHQVGLADDQLK